MKRILGSVFFLFISIFFFNNATFAANTNISSGVPIQGKMTSGSDTNTYTFTTIKSGEVYITLDQTTGGFSMYLYDTNGNNLGGDYYSSSGNKIVINKDIQEGTYYVKVTAYGWNNISSATYQVKATYASSIVRNNSTFEPNDTVETSIPISSGKYYKSTSETNIDRDVYQFTTNKDGEVYLTLDETAAGFSMYLYDSNGSNLGGEYYSSSGNKIVIDKKVEQGTYYVKVTPYGWNRTSSASYRIKATYSSPILRDTISFEPNDTIDTSMKVNSGQIYNSISESSIDKDVYQFTTNNNGEVYISLNHTTGGFSMYLYDENGDRLDGDYYSSAGNNIVINKNLTQGTYYIKINPYGWNGISSASYQLKATYASSITRNVSTFEPNETNQTSMTANSGQIYTSSSDSYIDRDVYQFTTNKDGEVYITLDNTTGGFSMYLYNENGTVMDSDYYSSGGNSIVFNTNLMKGTYFIKITPYGWNGISSASYRLKATYAAKVNRDASSFEPNETVDTAMQLISKTYYSSNSYSKNDRDVYRFTTSTDGYATIVLDNTTGGFSAYLFDKNGNNLGGDYYSSRGNIIKIEQPLTKGTYYIKVTPYGWSGIASATYRLKATFIDKTPSVNPIFDYSTNITGHADSNIRVLAFVGNNKIGEAAAKNGVYSINISKPKAGTIINIFTIDADENRSISQIVMVKDNIKPVLLGASSKTITINSVFNSKTGVTAKDNVDGDITKSIIVTGTVDTKKKGVYTLTYKVTDKSRNTTIITRKITVIDNLKPVISGVTAKTINYKSVFNPYTGVSARDNADGNLTSKLKVTGLVNTKKKGIFTLTYTVIDKSGNKTVVMRKITVR